MSRTPLLRSCLLAATALPIFAAPAFAQDKNVRTGANVQIVANDEVLPGSPFLIPGGPPAVTKDNNGSVFATSPDVLSTGITGVAQQIAYLPNAAQTGAGLSLCTGSLINARTIITAAHCLFNNPAINYGADTGAAGGINAGTPLANAYGTTTGIPLSFGFAETNRCLGATINGCAVGQGAYEKWRDSGFTTNVAAHIYNANQVWYRKSSQPVALGGGGEFANGDIALVTLDTHVRDIPTWTLLFSPLQGPAHAEITGYGGTGVGLAGIGNLTGIDYRRRSAENMIDALITNHDWRLNAVNSLASINDQHAIYFMDFDDPKYDPENLPANWFANTAPAGQRNNGYYDFNGLGGTALTNEGTTAGGDSGGPLVVDQTFKNADGSYRKVIAGVLTGSWSFNGGIATYGSFSVYPPLFPFWQEIVANNPYKYVSAKAGDGDWLDPTHWVQDMDPNFVVIGADGTLVNALPSFNQNGGDTVGSSGAGDMAVDKFGTLCGVSFIVPTCKTFDGPGPSSNYNGTSIITAGGPGSTNFVANNIEPVNSADPTKHKQARYFDVTLREAGTTSLGGIAVIDKLTLDGPSKLDIKSSGDLKVWAEFNQVNGWTNVDGKLTTAEALIVQGLLTGTGTFDPTVLTVVGGIVAPGGGDKIGTLTIKGDTILASASALFIDVRRGAADRLNVEGKLSLSGQDAGATVVFNKVTGTPAPRHGESMTIASATTLEGQFRAAATFQGVLRPELTYVDGAVTALFRAGSLVTILDGQDTTALAFAKALDTLRSGSYNSLFNFYGEIDWMNGAQLNATLGSLAPRTFGETASLHDRQSRRLNGLVADRLSLIGTGQANGMVTTGQVGLMQPRQPTDTRARLGLADGQSKVALGGGFSGFLDMSASRARSGYGAGLESDAARDWHVASGLEVPLGDAVVGSAFGIAGSTSTPGRDEADLKLQQAAAYASLPLGSNAYVGAMLSGERMRSESTRLSSDGLSSLTLRGAGKASRVTALVETGYRHAIGSLAVTPRTQLAYSRTNLSGFNEQGGETALKLDSLDQQRFEGRVGARLDGRTTFGSWTFAPSLQADYVRLLSGGANGMTVRFAAAPDAAIRLPLNGGGKGWAELKGGLALTRGAVSVGLTGNAAIGDSPYADQRGAMDLTFRF